MTPRQAKREKLFALLQENPTDTFLQYSAAMHLAGDGEAEAALERLSELLERDANYVPAWFQAGQLAAQLGRNEQSCGLLERGIAAARAQRDEHALGEMTAFLEQVRSEM